MPLVTYLQAGDVGRITLDRPAGHNAFDLQMAEDLASAIDSARSATNLRCLILEAEGRMFSSGGDIGAFQQAGSRLPALLLDMTAHVHQAISTLAAFPAPVICAVQGPVAGIALGLVLNCDVVIATRDASFVAGHTAIGLTPDGGLTHLLPRQIGLLRAKDMLLRNRRLTAHEALGWGLISQVVENDALAAATAEAARQLVTGAWNALVATKAAISRPQTFAEALASEAAMITGSASTIDASIGIAAFNARKRPVFSGHADTENGAQDRG